MSRTDEVIQQMIEMQEERFWQERTETLYNIATMLPEVAAACPELAGEVAGILQSMPNYRKEESVSDSEAIEKASE